MKPAVLAMLVLALAACGSGEEAAPPAAPLANALPELDSRTRALDLSALAADAFEPEALARLLEDAGYVAGSEREFSGKSKTFDHVVARTLSFETAGGAEEYLGWLRGHSDDLLGRSAQAKFPVTGRSGIAFALVPCGTCKKELPAFLAGWRRGETVLSLLAAGSGANPERFAELARELDGTLG